MLFCEDRLALSAPESTFECFYIPSLCASDVCVNLNKYTRGEKKERDVIYESYTKRQDTHTIHLYIYKGHQTAMTKRES